MSGYGELAKSARAKAQYAIANGNPAQAREWIAVATDADGFAETLSGARSANETLEQLDRKTARLVELAEAIAAQWAQTRREGLRDTGKQALRGFGT